MAKPGTFCDTHGYPAFVTLDQATGWEQHLEDHPDVDDGSGRWPW